jgi:uncharacterized cofD-like protein
MSNNKSRLVALGGGRGAGQVALGASDYFDEISLVVAVTDTGRSTGVARRLADVPAPGDLRNSIATLAADPAGLPARLMQHRFRSSEHPALDGMALGNLILVALTELTGDLGQAMAWLNDWLQPQAQVLPVSLVNTDLCAELADGQIVRGELAVRGLNKAPIARLFLADPQAPAYAPALACIAAADMVVIGPGSFFTSLAACLLFIGLREALQQSAARIVFVCNNNIQPGQTDGLRVVDHVRWMQHLLEPAVLDTVLINRSTELDAALLAEFVAEGLHPLQPDERELAAIADMGVEAIVGDFGERRSERRALWQKQDSIRHDPARLGQTLAALLAAGHAT